MVVAYRFGALTAFLLRGLRLVKVPYFSQPNLLVGRALVPEFLQEQVNGAALGEALLGRLSDGAYLRELDEEFLKVHETAAWRRRGACGRCRPGASAGAWRAREAGMSPRASRFDPRARVVSIRQRTAGSSRRVAGVDEAGRGPLAGPVVAAAVILDPRRRIVGLADSKALSPLDVLVLRRSSAPAPWHGRSHGPTATRSTPSTSSARHFSPCAARSCVCPCVRLTYRSTATNFHPSPTCRSAALWRHHRRRRARRRDQRRLHSRQDAPRRHDGGAGSLLPGLRARRAQGLRHSRAPRGAARRASPRRSTAAPSVRCDVALGPPPELQGELPLTGTDTELLTCPPASSTCACTPSTR